MAGTRRCRDAPFLLGLYESKELPGKGSDAMDTSYFHGVCPVYFAGNDGKRRNKQHRSPAYENRYNDQRTHQITGAIAVCR